MDVREILEMPGQIGFSTPLAVEITGWLVDKQDGLYILGDHYPIDHNFPYQIKVENGDIMHAILAGVSSFGGGKSLLFHRARLIGRLYPSEEIVVRAEQLFVESDNNGRSMAEILIDDVTVQGFVARFGSYEFGRVSGEGDWLAGL